MRDRLWHWLEERTRKPPRNRWERVMHRLFIFMEDLDLDGRR